jgi:DNA-binding NtrC family response regulator
MAQRLPEMMLAQANPNLQIAIIDDKEKELSRAYSRVIKELGYPSPSIFNDGRSMINALTRDGRSFDVVIIDYRIPEMSGIEAAKIIQRYRKEMKVIIATGNHFVRQEAIVAGLSFIPKRFSTDQLAECLDSRN